jgi:hypothetical protein
MLSNAIIQQFASVNSNILANSSLTLPDVFRAYAAALRSLNVQQLEPPGFAVVGGVAFTPVGTASLGFAGNKLCVTNNQSGDGMAVAVPGGGSGLDVGWQALPNTLPVGAYIQEQVVGTANGITEGNLGTVTITKTSTNYVVTADFTPINATGYTVQAYSNGVLVAQATHQPGVALASCNIWNDSGCCRIPEPIGVGEDWWTNVLVTIAGGGSALCNSLFITPENVSALGAWTDFQITASQVPSFTITSVRVSPLRLSLSASGQNAMLSWVGTDDLQQSFDLKTWSDVSGSTTPYSLPLGGTSRFFRLKGY